MTVSHDEDLAARLGKNGESAVRRKYNWEQAEAELLRLYASFGCEGRRVTNSDSMQK